MSDEQINDDLFDPENLRISGNDSSLRVEKILTTVLVRRPDAQCFIRVHPDEEYRLDTNVLKFKEQGEVYLVAEQLADQLPGARAERLHLYVDRNMHPGFWPIPLPDADGRENTWHRTARSAAEEATRRWVRIEADRALGGYIVFAATGEIEEPRWPKESMKELLKIAFGPNRLIRSTEHPVYRRLQGAV